MNIELLQAAALTEATPKMILNYIAIGAGIIGTLIAAFCFFPGIVKVIKTKDTRSMSYSMFLWHVIGCVVWILVGACNFTTGIIAHDYWQAFASGAATIAANISVILCDTVFLIYKYRNTHKAKLLKMSENEYYEKYVFPKLIKENKKKKPLSN